MRFVKRVNERGTTTLPNEVRAALDIQQGDLVEFEVLNADQEDFLNGSMPSMPDKPLVDAASDIIGGNA